MNRNPIEGDVVKIGRSQLLVIKAGMNVSKDDLRNDSYSCYNFHTIKDTDCGKPNPKVKIYTLTGGSMSGDNMIDLNEIELVKSVKVKKSISYSY